MVKGTVANGARRFYQFGPFRLDANRHRLLRNGEVVPLSPKAIAILTVLVQNPGNLLEREALMQAVWPNTIVEDANLTVAISQLRKAINQNCDRAECIQTIPRVGYRFLAQVKTVEQPDREAQLHGTAPQFGLSHHGNAATVDETAPAGGVIESPAFMNRPRRILALTAIVSVCGLVLLVLWRELPRARLPASAAELKSIAVLPLKTIGMNPEDEYLGLGLADALITQLGRTQRMAIRPISAVQSYANGKFDDPLSIGRQLGVEAVLLGSIHRDDQTVRVTLRLLRVKDGVALWSGKFDQKFSDIFAMQDSISEQVAAMGPQLSDEERRLLTKHGTRNIDAYQLYLKGRHAWNKRTHDELRKAVKFFQHAIDLDPTYAAGYAGLADSYLGLGDYEHAPPNETFPLARAAALRALEIDDGLAEAHAILAYVKFVFYWDWAAAEHEFLRAIELRPNYASTHHRHGMFLAAMGRTDEARREMKLAQDLDPLSLIIHVNVGQVEYYAHQYDKAIDQFRKVLQADPNFVQARRKLAFALEAKGMEQEAVAEWLVVKKQLGADDETLEAYQKACTSSGIRGYWLKALEIDRRKVGREAESLSSYYAQLGDREQAFHWLDRAYDQRNPHLAFAKVAPVYDNLRSDPRFNAFLQRMGL